MGTSVVEQLIQRGMKREDMVSTLESMNTYYNRLHMISGQIRQCRACPLHRSCGNGPYVGMGELHPKIVVVSDTPKVQKNGLGFMQNMAQHSVFLMNMFLRLGLEAEDVYWTHAIKCPTDDPKMMYALECHTHLANELAVLQPVAIVALGTVAISALAGEAVRIADAVGEEFFFEMSTKSIPVIPIRHPRTLLKLDDDEFEERTSEIWRSIRKIKGYL